MLTFLGMPAEGVAASRDLDSEFEKVVDLDGYYYRGFPIISSSDGGIKLDALLCTKECGVSIIHIFTGRELTQDFVDHVDDVHLKVTARLTEVKDLTRNRKLIVPVNSMTYAPLLQKDVDEDLCERVQLYRDPKGLVGCVRSEQFADSDLLNVVLSRLQSLTNLKKTKRRAYVQQPDSKGAVLKALERELATLDVSQTRAVLESVEGVQRIRGLAGSGKTVVLARKIAHIHSQNPTWKIAVTFNSRSLKTQFVRLISQFYEDATGESPDWDLVKVIHAWGSPNSTGIYYEACCENNSEYFDFGAARALSKSYGGEFEAVCERFLSQTDRIKPIYDVILVDEAQDFSSAFLKLCYALLKEPRRMVYAYDELQNLGDRGMLSPDEIWGADEHGNPIVKFNNSAQDIILDICYRNPGPILTSAHSFGFGIYHDPMIQMFDYPELWREIGYKVVGGELKEGAKVELVRSQHSSPALLSGHSDTADIIQVHKFSGVTEQAQWVASEIVRNIKEEEILPSDILVIHPDAKRLREEVGLVRDILISQGVLSSIAGVTASPDEFFSDDSVTFTSIYRAKGNEAAMVYVMNAEYCNTQYELSKKRNILFTAMTRSKAWLRVCGVGQHFDGIVHEFNQVKDKGFSLQFTYPTAVEREKMRIVNRDMTASEKTRVKDAKRSAENLAALLSGEVSVEDLPQDLREALLAKLKGG